MCADLEAARYGEHASNLGALLARRFGERFDVPAFVVDPVTIDEFEPVSRISGVPGIERKCRNHALNIKAVARCSADEMDVSFDKSRFVVAHLGGGISVCALRDGRIIDSTDALLGEGPFSAERAGTLPLAAVIDMCFEGGRSRDEVVKLLSCESGLRGYLGETRIPEICGLIDEGDEQARLVLEALMLQTAKWIGAMFVVLEGSVNAILLTGGMAKSQKLVDDIIRRVGALADVRIYPGELEMEALAAGALRVLRGEERAKQY
jgi:butyrate kinase